MESKWLWMVLIALLLGGWCDGCWDQEKTALLQLKPFFSEIWEEGKQTLDCCEWNWVKCNKSTGRVTQLFLNLTTTDVSGDLVDRYYENTWTNGYSYYYNSERDDWYLNATLFLPFEELKSLYLNGNSIAGCVYNEGFERLSSKLDKLEILDLSYNHFNDTILASLIEFLSLKSLNLAYNHFTGSNSTYGIKRLSKLNNLEILDLCGNMLGNNILSHLDGFTSLKSLFLQNCGLKRSVDMLEFNTLMNLKELYLGENEIESLGSLLQSKQQLKLMKLEVLGLSYNLFNNSIFSSLTALPNLKSLYINSNKLKGSIHIKELNALSNLEELSMYHNEVNNFIPSQDNETELNLINLKVLDLSENLFNNSILPSFGRLSNLKSLYIGSNKLKGSIHIKELNALSNLEELLMDNNEVNNFILSQDNETELNLVNLKVLDLSWNLFNNSILPSFGRLVNLKSLSFDGNKLEGQIDLTVLSALSNLEKLDISCSAPQGVSTDCSLSPKSLDVLAPSLKTLSLDGFNFNKTMTTQKLHNFRNLEELMIWESAFLQTNILGTFGELTSLKRLHLYDCEMNNTGSLTPSEGPLHLKNLEYLDIYETSLENNFLQKIGAMPSLKFLRMEDCEVNGSLLTQGPLLLKNLESLIISDSSLKNNFLQKIGAIPSLKFLSIRYCGVNGTLLTQDFCKFTNLQELDISNNNLMDKLPECFSNLTSLESLYLSYNQISGNISALESLTSLESLDLSSNQFSGNISALKSLTSLESLDLSYNQFFGNISAFENLTSLQLLILANNYIQIPSSLGPLFNLSKLKYIYAGNNTIYAETEMHSSTPTFQLNGISLSSCRGDVGSFPQFLYHQHDLVFVDLSNFYSKGEQFPIWLLENNTKLETLILTNSFLSGSLRLPLASHLGLSYLDISNNFFNGSIPIEIGALLPSLRSLNMSKNHFNGSIPSSFGDMSSLSSLDLSNNQLSGGIPEHLAMGCSSLQILALSNNRLQGKIFSTNFNLTNLRGLQLDGNNFSGRIPDFLSNSSFLSTLDVSNNQLSGTIPRWMGNMSFLEKIIMSNNHLEGTIPMEFCQLDLILLDLSINNISGSLPSCFNPSNIRQVHLSKNRLQGALTDALRNSSTLVTLDVSYNFLTGSIPSWVGRLSNLSYLLLNNNNFEGRIPTELCNLSHLCLINLSHNNLSGRIPRCLKITRLNDVSEDYFDRPRNPYERNSFTKTSVFSLNEPIEFTTKNVSYTYKGKNLPYMSGIDLSYNNLSGEIPYEIGNLSKILALSLSHNSLTGPIPPTFVNLMQMETLDLSYNNLSGNIPPEFAVLHFLSYFNVSYNNLSGKTPERIGQLGAFDESSYLGNPFLCGTLVQKNCSPIEPPKASTGNNEEDGSIDMGIFYVSFSVSYIMVLLSIAVVLYINPYWRQAWFYHVEMGVNSCYYFVIDNLPREFRCGNI